LLDQRLRRFETDCYKLRRLLGPKKVISLNNIGTLHISHSISSSYIPDPISALTVNGRTGPPLSWSKGTRCCDTCVPLILLNAEADNARTYGSQSVNALNKESLAFESPIERSARAACFRISGSLSLSVTMRVSSTPLSLVKTDPLTAPDCIEVTASLRTFISGSFALVGSCSIASFSSNGRGFKKRSALMVSASSLESFLT